MKLKTRSIVVLLILATGLCIEAMASITAPTPTNCPDCPTTCPWWSKILGCKEQPPAPPQ